MLSLSGIRLRLRKNEVPRGGWVLSLVYGPGAGSIGGWTAFIAWRSGSLRWLIAFRQGRVVHNRRFGDYYRIGLLEFGVTRTWGLVPYTSH